MGTVYEAVQDHPWRTVALKVVSGGVFSPRLARRFELEAELPGRPQHPRIANLGGGTAEAGGGSQPYFAMERITRQPGLWRIPLWAPNSPRRSDRLSFQGRASLTNERNSPTLRSQRSLELSTPTADNGLCRGEVPPEFHRSDGARERFSCFQTTREEGACRWRQAR